MERQEKLQLLERKASTLSARISLKDKSANSTQFDAFAEDVLTIVSFALYNPDLVSDKDIDIAIKMCEVMDYFHDPAQPENKKVDAAFHFSEIIKGEKEKISNKMLSKRSENDPTTDLDEYISEISPRGKRPNLNILEDELRDLSVLLVNVHKYAPIFDEVKEVYNDITFTVRSFIKDFDRINDEEKLTELEFYYPSVRKVIRLMAEALGADSLDELTDALAQTKETLSTLNRAIPVIVESTKKIA